MRRDNRRYCWSVLPVVLVGWIVAGCDIPVPITISETFSFNIDEAANAINLGSAGICLPQDALRSGADCPSCQGAPAGICSVNSLDQLPSEWPAVDDCKPTLPEGCPQLEESFSFFFPIAVDESENPDLDKADKVIDDIIINRLALDYEQNTVTRTIPEIKFWLGPYNKNLDPNNTEQSAIDYRQRLEGMTDEEFEREMEGSNFVLMATIPAVEPGFTGLSEVEFTRDGKRFLSQFLEDKQFALIARGVVELDTADNPTIPRGAATLRFTLRVTFFFSAA